MELDQLLHQLRSIPVESRYIAQLSTQLRMDENKLRQLLRSAVSQGLLRVQQIRFIHPGSRGGRCAAKLYLFPEEQYSQPSLEQQILDLLRVQPTESAQIRAGLGYTHSAYFSSKLAELVKSGRICRLGKHYGISQDQLRAHLEASHPQLKLGSRDHQRMGELARLIEHQLSSVPISPRSKQLLKSTALELGSRLDQQELKWLDNKRIACSLLALACDLHSCAVRVHAPVRYLARFRSRLGIPRNIDPSARLDAQLRILANHGIQLSPGAISLAKQLAAKLARYPGSVLTKAATGIYLGALLTGNQLRLAQIHSILGISPPSITKYIKLLAGK